MIYQYHGSSLYRPSPTTTFIFHLFIFTTFFNSLDNVIDDDDDDDDDDDEMFDGDEKADNDNDDEDDKEDDDYVFADVLSSKVETRSSTDLVRKRAIDQSAVFISISATNQDHPSWRPPPVITCKSFSRSNRFNVGG